MLSLKQPAEPQPQPIETLIAQAFSIMRWFKSAGRYCQHFGYNGGPLCLKQRMLARLVERLVTMQYKLHSEDGKDSKVFEFYLNGFICLSVSITASYHGGINYDDFHHRVEIIDNQGQTIVDETIRLFDGSVWGHHPLCDLIDLLLREETHEQARKIGELLRTL